MLKPAPANPAIRQNGSKIIVILSRAFVHLCMHVYMCDYNQKKRLVGRNKKKQIIDIANSDASEYGIETQPQFNASCGASYLNPSAQMIAATMTSNAFNDSRSSVARKGPLDIVHRKHVGVYPAAA